MRGRTVGNIIALGILVGVLAFGFSPKTEFYPLEVVVYVQEDKLTWSAMSQEFQEGSRILELVADDRYHAQFPQNTSLILNGGEHTISVLYRLQEEVLDQKSLQVNLNQASKLRIDINALTILGIREE